MLPLEIVSVCQFLANQDCQTEFYIIVNDTFFEIKQPLPTRIRTYYHEIIEREPRNHPNQHLPTDKITGFKFIIEHNLGQDGKHKPILTKHQQNPVDNNVLEYTLLLFILNLSS